MQQPQVPLSGIYESSMEGLIAGQHVILDTAKDVLKQWIVAAVVEKDVIMRARVAAAQQNDVK
jgi:hypothetical protein